MTRRIEIIGVGADGPAGLRADLLDRLQAADFLAGGERHLLMFPSARGDRFVIKNNLELLADELRRRNPEQSCVVIASGDPLFHGVGAYLVNALGPERLRVEPAASSMQWAFARAGLSWHDASLASIHGHELRATLLPLLGHPKIGLFTQDGDSPAAVARFQLRFGLDDYEAIVGENLGSPAERVTHWPDLEALAGQRFGPLNYLVLRRTRPAKELLEIQRRRSLVPGAPAEEFERPRDGTEMMTRPEVRSVLLGKLSQPMVPGDTVWDIGAGLGTVAIELAVLRPHVEVVAFERDPVRLGCLRRNRQRFGAYNVSVAEGTAPGVLAGRTETPSLVFIGGSGAHLVEILDRVAERLRPGGGLLANFVTLEHLAQMLGWLKARSWPFQLTRLGLARGDSLGNLTGLNPQRDVFIVATEIPRAEHA